MFEVEDIPQRVNLHHHVAAYHWIWHNLMEHFIIIILEMKK